MIVALFEYLLVFLFLFAIFAVFADLILRSNRWKGPMTDHFDGARFFSLGKGIPAKRGDKGGWDVIKWMFSRDKNVWKERRIITSKPPERIMGKEILATFVNHATVLIQTEGLNILTDPVWSDRASPIRFLGPKRYARPGVAFEDLPRIDLVLLSHNHYDHMDVGALRKLKERFSPIFIVPLGNKAFLKKKGIESNELDWWDVADVKGAKITLVPAQHFSARAISDRNRTLWGGYVIGLSGGDIYFAGDTGYGPFIENIKERFPKGFRFGIVPIGAFKPEWFMSDIHMGPKEAMQLVSEVSIKKALAIHFGTFKLADDAQDEPVEILERLQGSNKKLEALMNGELIAIE